jgi:hypothetical protein
VYMLWHLVVVNVILDKKILEYLTEGLYNVGQKYKNIVMKDNRILDRS